MLKRLFFCIKLQILRDLCTRYIVLLDFLKLLILLSSFLCRRYYRYLFVFFCIFVILW